MATHSSILAWRMPWTEEPGGLQSTGSHTAGHDGSNLAQHSVHLRQVLSRRDSLDSQSIHFGHAPADSRRFRGFEKKGVVSREKAVFFLKTWRESMSVGLYLCVLGIQEGKGCLDEKNTEQISSEGWKQGLNHAVK